MDRGKYKLVVLGLSLAALTAGLVAGWSLRSPARRVPEDKPARALSPVTRPSLPPEQFMVFSAEKSLPPTTPDLLPTASQLYCFYSFPQLAADARMTVHWWRDGKDLGLVTDLRPAEAQVSKPAIATDKQEKGTNARPGRYVILSPPAGEDEFAPGIYEVELHSGDQRLGRRSFVVAADAQKIMASQPSEVGEVRVVSCVTARSITPTGEPQQPVSKFAPQERIYVAFAYINGTKGEKLRVEWYGGDQRLESAAQELAMKGAAGRGSAWLQVKDKGLPAGEYRVAVFGTMADEPLAEARFTVRP
ncbi:MAG: hypothetical protein KAW89_01760 [Armatimonadetes bacterium]|nr:hypothetical protein [Armatimonadota bacterium]